MNFKTKQVQQSRRYEKNCFCQIFQNCNLWSFLIISISAVYLGPICFPLLPFNNHNVSSAFIIVKDWERIAETDIPEKFYVYSAFYDYLGGDGVIKILGATTPTTQRKLYCHLFDKGLNHYEVVGATIQVTRHASRELPISPVTIFCKLYRLKNLPAYVALSPNRVLDYNAGEDKIIPVTINNPNDLNRQHEIPQHLQKNWIEFAACVQPTYDYDNVWQLLQWIEFQMLMGVEHFTFYNISIGPSASRLIQLYNSKYNSELISILPWHNIKLIPELHNNGQVLQATDCAARYKNIAKFVVVLDFDEYILPQTNLSQPIHNYQQLIQFSLKNVLNVSHGAFPVQFQFRSGLFGLGFPEFKEENSKLSEIDRKIKDNLCLVKHITRLQHIKPFHDRAKFITMPDFVTEPGIHSMVYATPRNGIELLIPETVAYVYHYRKCNWASDCGGGKEIVEDKTGHFWAEKLLPRVMTRYQEVVELCGIQL